MTNYNQSEFPQTDPYPGGHFVEPGLPEMSQDGPDAVGQPPPGMRNTRFVQLKDMGQRYVPDEPDPSAMMVVRRDPFMAVVRELAGGQMSQFRAYAQALEGAVVDNIQEVVTAQLQAAEVRGYEMAMEHFTVLPEQPPEQPVVPDDIPGSGIKHLGAAIIEPDEGSAFFEEETGEKVGNSSFGFEDLPEDVPEADEDDFEELSGDQQG